MNENLFNEINDGNVPTENGQEFANEVVVSAKVLYTQINYKADKLLLHLDKELPAVVKTDDEVFEKTMRDFIVLSTDYIVKVVSAKADIQDLIRVAKRAGSDRNEVVASIISNAELKIKATLRPEGTAYEGGVLEGDKYDYQVIVVSLKKQVYEMAEKATYRLMGLA